MDCQPLVPLDVDAGGLAVVDDDQRFREVVKRCRHDYRAVLQWARISTVEDIERLIVAAGESLDSGDFWLARLGRVAETDAELVMALLCIRMRWVEELGQPTTAERILLDQVLLALYHELRLHEFIGNVQARAEHGYFGDEPLRAVNVTARAGVDQYEVDEHLRRINERMLPALERCQRMIIRSLTALQAQRGHQLTIHHAGQVNLAQQQLIVGTPAE